MLKLLKTVNTPGIISFFFRKSIWVIWSSFAVETENFIKIDQEKREIKQVYIWGPWLSDLLRRNWFTSSVWNFCRWSGADVPPGETSIAARSKEKWLYSQATWIWAICDVGKGIWTRDRTTRKVQLSFPHYSVLLSAPLHPIRPDRNSKSQIKFLSDKHPRKLRGAATFLNSCSARFLQIYAEYYITRQASVVATFFLQWTTARIWRVFFIVSSL